MLRRVLIAAPLMLLARAAVAADDKAAAEGGQYVDLLPLGLPIVVNGRLVNYVFVHVRINLAASADPLRARAKEPHLRDALVRAAHRTPFTVATDHNKIDTAKLAAALMRDAATILGRGQVRSVAVTSQQPRRRVATPRA